MKEIKTIAHGFGILGTLMFFIISCQSPTKLVQKQKYNKAFDRVIKHIKKGKDLDVDMMYALEDAFSSTVARDMSYIEAMKNKNRADNWDLIYDRASAIEERQAKIEPYLPIYATNGQKANFNFVKTDVIKTLAAQKATEKYYNMAKSELIEGESGNKLAARQAYNYLNKINRYNTSYKDQAKLKREAEVLGMTYVKVQVHNNSFNYLPKRLEDQILNRLAGSIGNRKWITTETPGINKTYDYNINYNIARFDISPDNYRETIIQESKILEDSYFLKDDKGDFVLDVNNEKIEITTSETVRATVIKVVQSKEATIAGELIIEDLELRRIVNSRPIIVEKVFLKESCTYTGDERALSGGVPNLGPPVRFPREEDLIRDAVDELENLIGREVRSTKLI